MTTVLDEVYMIQMMMMKKKKKTIMMVKLRVHRCPTSKALINLFILCPLGFCSASTVPLSTCLLFLPTCFLSCPYCLPSVYFFTISALSVLCIVMFPSLLWPAVFGVLLYASALFGSIPVCKVRSVCRTFLSCVVNNVPAVWFVLYCTWVWSFPFCKGARMLGTDPFR